MRQASILRLLVPGLPSRSGRQAAEYLLFFASIVGYCVSCWVVVARCLACLLACLPACLLAGLPACWLAWPFFSLLSLLPRGLSSDVRFGPIVNTSFLNLLKGEAIANFFLAFLCYLFIRMFERPSFVPARQFPAIYRAHVLAQLGVFPHFACPYFLESSGWAI